MNNRYKSIIDKIGNQKYQIENPSRYFGSEFFYGNKKYKEGDIKCAVCFPDLYEIGMSNNAVRIIYDLFNRNEGVFADRVFAVAPDFEKILRDKNIPLFTIKENFPVNSLDYLGITLSSELGATNILQIIDLAHMDIHTEKRKETDPVIIMGGPAATNPVPFGDFVDFVHIGEAEADTDEIIGILKKYKNRSERINELKKIPYLWYKGKREVTKRAVDLNFEKNSEKLQHYVVPAFEVAQDNGTVEIMRGCPNGCRFCHAGQFYKPFRQRSIEIINDFVKQSVEEFGYREVTLSSLSSGDYPNLDVLIKKLNRQYKDKRISFSLPSLKVSSFSLGILEQISEVRKSGLTFAIETPLLENQRSMNKEVPVEQIIQIIQEAKSRGWKLAKFYFMVGLPFVDKETELESIVSYLSAIFKATKINMNINIGTFIPKPLTPFQWARQFTIEESREHLSNIKHELVKAIPGIKVSYHEPEISFLEGIISRGDETTSKLIENAYSAGCRLDAWDEYLDVEKWKQAFADTSYNTGKNAFQIDETLPWDNISLNVSKNYLLYELKKAENHELTSICSDECKHNCGVCNKQCRVKPANNELNERTTEDSVKQLTDYNDYYQVIITYSKNDKAIFNSHIAVMRQFEMAFQRGGLDIRFTQGFNPKPKLEFVNPLSMGVSGDKELLLCELPENQINAQLIGKLNANLAEGFVISDYKKLDKDSTGRKISLASKLVSSEFVISDIIDPVIRENLENDLTQESKDYCISKIDDCYKVLIKGEKNLFKLLFSEELNKFYIAGSCCINREKINLENI